MEGLIIKIRCCIIGFTKKHSRQLLECPITGQRSEKHAILPSDLEYKVYWAIQKYNFDVMYVEKKGYI